MEVLWVVDRNGGDQFHYKFVDYIFGGYSGQDNVQVASAIQEIRRCVEERNSLLSEIVIASNNALCFSSKEHISFIYCLKKNFGMPKTVCWILTDPCTGRGRLDTYFSCMNVVLNLFFEESNSIDLDMEIVETVSIWRGASVTFAIL